jgi:RNA polymerase sigma-70 factor (ECF subfamily)
MSKIKRQTENKDDKILIARAKKNPPEFEAVYRKYANQVFNYLWYRVGHNREVAEDLTQEVFVRAFEHLPKFRQRGYSYRTYLFSIAKNLWINFLKKKKPDKSLDDVMEVPVEAGQAQRIDNKIAAERLWRAIQKLRQPEKDAILMRYREELPIKDIAAVMGKSPNAVKIILSRARAALRSDNDLRQLIYFADTAREYVRPRFLKKT